MIDVITSILILFGAFLMLVAAIGIIRMPDVFTRMHAATKTSTLGAGSMFLAVAIFYGEIGIATRALLVIAFLFLTVPVSAHMIARAAYFVGTPLWEGTVIDELRDAYNPVTHELEGKEVKLGPIEEKIEQRLPAEAEKKQ